MSLAELSTSAFSARGDGPPQSDDRVPPQDLHAEQSVLGGMLLSKDAIADCVEGLRGTDFYRPAHELIYDAILDLYGRGEPADAITVSDELTKRGDLQRIGGQAYLHTLIQAVPTAANAGYYAEIVSERAVLRRLVEAGTRIVQLGYQQGNGDVEDIVNAAQAEVYAVADRRGGEDYVALGDVLEDTLNEIEVAAGRDANEMLGVPTGFIELDELTHGLHPGQMIVLAARPAVGKSTMGLDIARCAAIKHKQATAVFSLEMSRSEITMRCLSAEAQIQLQDLRKGTIGDAGWKKLARIMGQISDSPLFIDDSPEHVAHGDPGQVPPAQAAAQPQARRHRLPPAHELGQEGRVPPAGGLRVLPCAQAARQGARGPGHRDLAAEPWFGAACRQAARDVRPA